MTPANPVIAEWIGLHVAAPFAEQVAWMRGQIDRHGPGLPLWRQERVAHAFARTLALEIDFHDAPYMMSSSEGRT
jgi:thiaminase/transcriptional activator TenA